MVPNMKELVKQAQKMQQKITQMQEELALKKVEATSGGGMVKVVVNGKNELVSISIEKEVINPEDPDMLQDLIIAAVNEGMHRAKEMVESEMSKVTGNMKIPGMF